MSTQPSEPPAQSPRQLTLPYIDTSFRVWWIVTSQNALAFAVPLVALLFGLVAYMVHNWVVFYPAFGLGLVTLPIVIWTSATNPHYTTVRERVLGALTHRKLKRETPLGLGELQTRGRNVHGVVRFGQDGSAVMADGRVVGVIGVDGINTSLATGEEANRLVSNLGVEIDEHIRDFEWSIFATTSTSDIDEILESYESRAEGQGATEPITDGSTSQYARDLLLDVAQWLVDVDEPQWESTQWEYYIVVSVDQSDITIPEASSASQSRSLLSALPGHERHPGERRRTHASDPATPALRTGRPPPSRRGDDIEHLRDFHGTTVGTLSRPIVAPDVEWRTIHAR